MTEEQVQKISYNPEKIYQWKIDENFTFSGYELHILNEYLTNFVVGSLDVPSILKVAAAKKLVQDIIARNVESGKIVESSPETIENNG